MSGLIVASLSGCFASPPQIIQLTPSRGAVGVAADAPITVEFDRAVSTGSVVGRFSVNKPIPGCDLAAAFSAGPLAPCRIVWLDGDTEFTLLHPRAILAPNTSYRFTLAGGISDPSGVVNSVDHQWTITTGQAPVIRSIEPANGAIDVPVDTPIAVSFSTSMAVATTEDAIQLSPPVPGTRVVRNRSDTSRFVVLPGTTLESGVTYRLSIAATAADSHHQPLVAGQSVTFTTRGLSRGPHAVVLARAPDEGATTVLLSQLAPAQAGEPISTEALLVAPRCDLRLGCGAAPEGAPLYTYSAAVLSPGGLWVAVVEVDNTVVSAQPVLVVLNPATGTVLASFARSSMPSWSPDGATLAFSRAGSVAFFDTASQTVTSLPQGDPLVVPAVWSPLGEQLVLDVAGPTDVEHLELADSVVLARYAVPRVTGQASAPVISPDGAQLAFVRSAPPAQGTWLVGIGANPGAPRLLDQLLQPVGFTATGTLVGIRTPVAGSPTLVLVSVAGDEQIAIPTGPAPGLLNTVVVAPSGRQLVYLSPDAAGIVQAYVENADGSHALPITTFTPRTLVAAAVTVSG
ncbi:MAG: Ig-like domain-containing protein [Candidatus Dormiibacterota bacterium]